MKKIKLILSFAFCAILMNSCNDDDLFQTNPNELSPDTFFKTEAQVQSAVNATYASLQTRGLYSRHMFFMMDNMSHENAGNPQLESDKRAYLDFSFDSSHGAIGAYWETCFIGISNANFVIGNQDKINEIPDSFLSPAKKAKFVGEAKFMRALYYFFLTTRFGDLPLIVGIPESGEGLARSPQSEVYAQIVTDLTDASNTLLDKDSEIAGRATKGAAIALLGKVKLFMGDKGGALAEFKKLSGYSLEANYFDNFTEEGEHGSESIFEAVYDDSLGSGDKWNSDRSGQGAINATFRGQEYGCLNWFNVYPSDDLLDEYEAGDTRYADNFYTAGDIYEAGASVMPILKASDGDKRAGWKKYQNYYKDASEDQESGINFKVIRYSDVLLMMAECTSGTEATGYINQVRARAGLAPTTASTDAEIFEAIVHERKVELAGEQTRFNDIIRWGIASTELAGTKFRPGISELLPIPNIEISSNVNATQNTGY